jgi:predicted Ser/Thr protein kinase
VDVPDDLTVASGASHPATPPGRDGTFATGDLVGGRYRIVGMLGRGGMGEVYRADDLTLGQTVALKFLPRSVERNPEQLERLRAEVRITRQVSHPNVCRVYDLGEVDGRHFLTMEYVDGEDLSSLLRRIGRLPADKVLDVARQLCAGLAAAHDRGVIHRDLKPANVMLDGRGKVRVTDFGLAIADEAGAAADRSGTPAYMAPEQLAGKALSPKTDIYALGLVLYELYAGRRLFEAGTLDELMRLQSNAERLRMSASSLNLDPAVERVIVRCVEFDPAKRPDSALQVAAALPGGDPLAAALAAGETPSPELVAAAGEDAKLPLAMTVGLLAIVVVGCLSSGIANARTSAFAILQPPYSAEVLAIKAREMLQRLRPDYTSDNTAATFDVGDSMTSYLRAHRDFAWQWRDLPRLKPSPVIFWQRSSPRPLLPLQFPGGTRVSLGDPPRTAPGLALVVTDVYGRLTHLEVKPSAEDDKAPAVGDAPWPRLFQEAGLDMARFTPAPPEWIPPSWSDARAAWTGSSSEYPTVPLRVEATALHGRPTFFVVAAPWTPLPGTPPTRPPASLIAVAIVALLAITSPIVAGILMARWNIKNGRADRRGAARLAAFVGIVQMAATWLVMAHVASPAEIILLAQAFVWPAIVAILVWVLYVALEPYVRRTWPSALISWNRIIEGRIRDGMVARDVLVGVAATALFDGLDPLVKLLAPSDPRGMTSRTWLAVTSLRESLGSVANAMTLAIFASLVLVLFYFLVRIVVRRDWIATALFAAVFTANLVAGYLSASGKPSGVIVVVAMGILFGIVWMGILARFGLIAFIALQLSDVLISSIVTLNPSAWYSGPSLLNLLLVAALAGYAGWVCLANRAAPVAKAVPSPSVASV